jgi:hypothetical protein
MVNAGHLLQVALNDRYDFVAAWISSSRVVCNVYEGDTCLALSSPRVVFGHDRHVLVIVHGKIGWVNENFLKEAT